VDGGTVKIADCYTKGRRSLMDSTAFSALLRPNTDAARLLETFLLLFQITRRQNTDDYILRNYRCDSLKSRIH
jgi:hypothetical protein